MNDDINQIERQEQARIGLAAIIGALLGAASGLYWHGIGGAVLFLILGGLGLAFLASNLGLALMRNVIVIVVVIVGLGVVVELIGSLWGVGQIAD